MSLKEFFLGKEISEDVDVGKSKATIVCTEGTFFLSMTGEVRRYSVGRGFTSTRTSENLLKAHLSNVKNIFEADCGKLILVHNILSIQIDTIPHIVKFTYKE